MEEKYYTPTIEEFHIGFEYEIKNPNWRQYDKLIVNEDFFNKENGFSDYWAFKRGEVRIKLLDKEDIESLGFKWGDLDAKSYKKDNFILQKYSNNEIAIFNTKAVNKMRFRGIIKNKSELKKLMSQLKIKHD